MKFLTKSEIELVSGGDDVESAKDFMEVRITTMGECPESGSGIVTNVSSCRPATTPFLRFFKNVSIETQRSIYENIKELMNSIKEQVDNCSFTVLTVRREGK